MVEIQIAAFIASIILLAAVSLYTMYWRTFVTDSAYLDVYSSSRIAVDHMVRDIRCAAQVVTNYGSYTTTDNTIVLQVPSIDNSNPPITINSITSDTNLYYDYIIYTLIYNNNLQSYDLYRIVQIDGKFTTAGDSYYHKNGRVNENRAVAHHCGTNSGNLLTFSSGSVGGTTLSHVTYLSDVNTIGISLPINEKMLSLSGSGTNTAQMIPTAVVRMRNK